MKLKNLIYIIINVILMLLLKYISYQYRFYFYFIKNTIFKDYNYIIITFTLVFIFITWLFYKKNIINVFKINISRDNVIYDLIVLLGCYGFFCFFYFTYYSQFYDLYEFKKYAENTMFEYPIIYIFTDKLNMLESFCEEIIFRAYIFNFTRKYSNIYVAILSNIFIFIILHVKKHDVPITLTVGTIIIILCYVLTSNLYITTLLHFSFNFTQIAKVSIFKNVALHKIFIYYGILGSLVFVLYLLFNYKKMKSYIKIRFHNVVPY